MPEVLAREGDLGDRLEDDALKSRLTENADFLEEIAVLTFHRALRALPPEHRIDEDATINPQAISLQPERWEADGLRDGSGITLAEARGQAPNLAEVLLEHSVDPR